MKVMNQDNYKQLNEMNRVLIPRVIQSEFSFSPEV